MSEVKNVLSSRYNDIKSPLLQQIYRVAQQALRDMGEPYRIRVRPGTNCETMRIFTLSTDYSMRFSVLDRSPQNVHMNVMRYLSVFEDERRAGWKGEMNCDFKADRNMNLSIQALTNISDQVNIWLALSKHNARTPRTCFPCEDNKDKAANKWTAASFLISDVVISTKGNNYSVEFHNRRLGLKAVLMNEQAEAFDMPQRTVGCRAIIHHSGVIRVMRESNFTQFYQLI